MSEKGAARNQKINIVLPNQKSVAVYASPKILHALELVTDDMDIFKGVKLKQVLEAIYLQGCKDGARDVIDRQTVAFEALKASVPHRNPGKPKKTPKAKKAARPSVKKAAKRRPQP